MKNRSSKQGLVESKNDLLSVLPPLSNGVFRRYLNTEFITRKELGIKYKQLASGLEMRFTSCLEWEGSVMEFIFSAKGTNFPFVNGFLPFCGLSVKKYCENAIHIPNQAMVQSGQANFTVEIYPIDVGELSAKDGDGTNLFWSVLIADLSAYGNWFEFCQRLDREGDSELELWIKKIRGVISKL